MPQKHRSFRLTKSPEPDYMRGKRVIPRLRYAQIFIASCTILSGIASIALPIWAFCDLLAAYNLNSPLWGYPIFIASVFAMQFVERKLVTRFQDQQIFTAQQAIDYPSAFRSTYSRWNFLPDGRRYFGWADSWLEPVEPNPEPQELTQH